MIGLALAGVAVVLLAKKGTPMNTEIDDFYAWDNLIHKYADGKNVPWTWVKAIMMNESNLGRAPSVKKGLMNPLDIQSSKSSDGKSWGLMQLTLPTARMFEPLITEAGLNDPDISIRIGVKYLNFLWDRIPRGKDPMEFVVRAYNGGPGFATTVAGKRDTPLYFERFKKNLAYITQDRKQK